MNFQKSFRQVGFFQVMAILFLVLTFVGFAPSFYLRPLYEATSLPLRFHIHGFFMTCWIFLFLIQSILIAKGKVSLHRKLGVWGAIIGSGVLISGLAILYYLIMEYDHNSGKINQMSSMVWGNIAILTSYTTFVVTGILYRSRPQTHKHLMLLSTLSIMGQPLTRIGHFDVFRLSESLITNDTIYGLGGLLVLFLMVGIYDLFVMKRIHITVLWGMPLQIGLTIIFGLMIARTAFGQGLILLFHL